MAAENIETVDQVEEAAANKAPEMVAVLVSAKKRKKFLMAAATNNTTVLKYNSVVWVRKVLIKDLLRTRGR